MRKISHLVLLLVALCVAPAAIAQVGPDWNPRTGDAWVDATLGDINEYGDRYPDAFVDELVRYHDAPRDYVAALIGTHRWAPGDVYYACAIGQAVGRSCRYVAEAWQRHRGEGWGALAQRLGIAPGSDAFHRLKRGFARSYEHWGRPPPRAAAGHGKAKGH